MKKQIYSRQLLYLGLKTKSLPMKELVLLNYETDHWLEVFRNYAYFQDFLKKLDFFVVLCIVFLSILVLGSITICKFIYIYCYEKKLCKLSTVQFFKMLQ